MKDLCGKEIVTCSEMKALEQAADAAGLSYYQMMENAGTEAFSAILQRHPHTESALVFCGKGNNGGDGLVVARKLLEAGIKTRVILIEGEPVTNDAKTNYQLLQEKVQFLTADEEWNIAKPDLIVDAIYGTGFHGQLLRPAKNIITRINESEAFTVSLDIPSGLSGDMEVDRSPGLCVKADLTVAFHARKPVHRNKLAAVFMGDIITADIGIKNILRR